MALDVSVVVVSVEVDDAECKTFWSDFTAGGLRRSMASTRTLTCTSVLKRVENRMTRSGTRKGEEFNETRGNGEEEDDIAIVLFFYPLLFLLILLVTDYVRHMGPNKPPSVVDCGYAATRILAAECETCIPSRRTIIVRSTIIITVFS